MLNSFSRPSRPWQRWLIATGLYPLVLASGVACMMLLVRIRLNDSLAYTHLVWNLFLAWIPYGCSLWTAYLAQRSARPRWRLLGPSLLWLLFLPNAAYLVTEYGHLLETPGFALWFDIGMLTAFGWTGCLLAVASLRLMHELVRTWYSVAWGWLFVVGAVSLNGFGVYLGRFLRWNSWDAVLNPRLLLNDVLDRVINPLSHSRTYGVTLMFAGLLLVCYLTVTAVGFKRNSYELLRGALTHTRRNS